MNSNSVEHPKILFVVGAGRSGTNLLCRMLEARGGFTDLSENRYVWNYGQPSFCTDRRVVDEATDTVKNFIRGHFFKLSRQHSGYLIDKTPGNAMRLNFVHCVFPEAKIVNIIRDGRANTLSRLNLWDEGPLFSTSKKRGMLHRYVKRLVLMYRKRNLPLSRVPRFLIDNIPDFVTYIFTGKRFISGERVAGLREIERTHGVAVARAIQWRDVASISAVEGRKLGSATYHEVRYEDLLLHPGKTMRDLFSFLNLSGSETATAYLEKHLDLGRLENWKKSSADTLGDIEPFIAATLEYFGYGDLESGESKG